MSNAQLFKQAHAMTRATIQAGDDYRATFGLCLKAIKADKQGVTAKAKKVAKAVCAFIAQALVILFILSPILAAGIGLVAAIESNKQRTEDRQYQRVIDNAASYNYLNRFNNQ